MKYGWILLSLLVLNISQADNRIRKLSYDAKKVTNIVTSIGNVTMIEFSGENETVVNAATGFTEGYDISAVENTIYIKPISYQQEGSDPIDPIPDEWKTNLVVKTNKRSYVFQITVADPTKEDEVENATFALRFDYPEERAAKLKAQKEIENQMAEERRQKREEQTIKQDLATEPKVLNYQFFQRIGKNSEEIIPDFAYDDGDFTYIGFSEHKVFPSVFISDAKGNEELVNTHTEAHGAYQVLVVHSVTKQLILRSGDSVIGLYNHGAKKRASGSFARTGTKSSVVKRVTKK